MATKFGAKSAINRLVYDVFRRYLRPTGGFRGRAIEECQKNSTTTNPVVMATKFGNKIGYNSACIRNISEMLASNRGFSGLGY